jgi:uncharacterized membrane protein YhiD involved in acid resistance
MAAGAAAYVVAVVAALLVLISLGPIHDLAQRYHGSRD